MPSASESEIPIVNSGFRKSIRRPNFRSCMSIYVRPLVGLLELFQALRFCDGTSYDAFKVWHTPNLSKVDGLNRSRAMRCGFAVRCDASRSDAASRSDVASPYDASSRSD